MPFFAALSCSTSSELRSPRADPISYLSFHLASTNMSSQYIFLGIANPLLDISARVDPALLNKYNLKSNDAILAGEEHKPLYKELVDNYPIEYIAGGAA